jgi:hypothetical protein
LGAALAASIEQFASMPRLQRYRAAATSDLDTAILYCWNIHLGEALLPSLAVLEVTLRNSVHNVLTHHAGTEWWFKTVLHPVSCDNALKIVGGLTKRQGHPPTVGKVISEITFGFWPKLFAHSYNAFWWDAPHRLLAQVIPNHPNVARDTRSKFEERLEYFVELRNRAMHQEAIFEGVKALNKPILPIDTLHDQIVETIGWINLDAQRLIKRFDRFDAVFSPNGKAQIEHGIKAEFNIP